MSTQGKAKLLILSAILILIALVCAIGFQLVKIKQIEKEINQQEKEINEIQKELDGFNKQPDLNDEYYDIIIGGEN